MQFFSGSSSFKETIIRRGSRITPRTCLWPLAGSLIVTFCLSIGLTFRSNNHCYAGTCGETLFPLQARLHVIVWYMWISISVIFLAIRAFHPTVQKALDNPLMKSKLPFLPKRLTLGGATMVCWVLTLYGIVVGIWWKRLNEYFVTRNAQGGISAGGHQLAAVALTGHFCDITMGMVLLPISRHSALASFFKLSVSTTLTNHMLAAYTLFTLVFVHGIIYVSWIPVFNSLSNGLKKTIPVLNPTYMYDETWPGDTSSLGIWRASLIFSGIIASAIMLAIFITTFPRIRHKHFNLFYFTHLMAIPMVIIICLHASTVFYCTAPGFACWILDWLMRIYELRAVLQGEIGAIGNGWYCLTVPLPRGRLSGCSCKSPLAYFYIHHAGSSIRELHPFTTITPLAAQSIATPAQADSFDIKFIFRKQGRAVGTAGHVIAASSYMSIGRLFRSKKSRLQSTQWTNRLADLIDLKEESSQISASDQISSLHVQPTGTTLSNLQRHNHDLTLQTTTPTQQVGLSLRLEGPYFSPADPSRYNTVVCLAAGTGISGAIAIAAAFTELQRLRLDAKSPYACCAAPSSHWTRCIVVWSVRATDAVQLPFHDRSTEGLELRTHLTGEGRSRLDMDRLIREVRAEGVGEENGKKGRKRVKIWVYVSGPSMFNRAAKAACKVEEGVDCYAPSWDI